jgi:hypothetical protein
MIDSHPGASNVVITDHVQSWNRNVVASHGDRRDFACHLSQALRTQAVRDEDESLDLELQQGVDFVALSRGVVTSADQHGAKPLLADLGLNTVQNLRKNRIMKVKN